MKNKVQSVWITLSDGSKHGFTGEAFVFPGDKRFVTGVTFTEPKELAPGYELSNEMLLVEPKKPKARGRKK